MINNAIVGDSTSITAAERPFVLPLFSLGGHMSIEHNHQYFIRREAEERAAAASTTEPSAKACHVELAKLYAAKVKCEPKTEPDPSKARIVQTRTQRLAIRTLRPHMEDIGC